MGSRQPYWQRALRHYAVSLSSRWHVASLVAAEAAIFDLSCLAHRRGYRRGKVERFLLRSLRDR
eukprot:7298651-Lingulodinium_polyedra.AAC.1